MQMQFIVTLLADAALIVLLARWMPQIHIQSYGKAVLAAFLIALFNALLSDWLNAVLNFLTFGILSALMSLVVTAVLVKLVDLILGSFEVKGFWPALVIGSVIGLMNYLIAVFI